MDAFWQQKAKTDAGRWAMGLTKMEFGVATDSANSVKILILENQTGARNPKVTNANTSNFDDSG